MDRTGPAELVPAALAGYEADQIQDFSQGQPLPDGIEIVRVLHGARDLDRLLELET